jgi:proline dehydrogenase
MFSMLRAMLLYLSQAGWAKRMVMGWGLAKRVARRFVAGETMDEALDAVRVLNDHGLTATIDVLGESITEMAEAHRATENYLALLRAIHQRGLKSSVSLKLTALGLDIDPALCRANMQRILDCARVNDLTVTIDMEDHTYTDRTLAMFRALRREDGFDNLLAAVQSYLYRTDQDVLALEEESANLRLCKGAYREPASVAYPKKADVDAAYVRQMQSLLDAAAQGRGYPGIATHDQRIIEQTITYAQTHSIPVESFEFQMLYGIRTDLQRSLIEQGWRMRVYVPYGTQWYPYFMRRLAERPANLWFFLSNLVRA